MKLTDAPDDKLVAKYVELRDEVAQREAQFKTEIAVPKSKMEKIEIEFLRRFNERGAESVRTAQGTAYRTVRTSVTCGDWETFFNTFVVPQQAWEFIEHRPSKTSVLQFRGEHNDLPPGINLREEAVVGFRRA